MYQILAEIVLVMHFCFVLFVVFGGVLILYRRFIIWLHLPAVAWGILVEIFHLPCPLTWLENGLRELGGEAGYAAGGFIDFYVSAILYAHITPQFQMFLGVLLVVFNLLVYRFVFRQTRRFE
jgi:hypothetical protein